MKAVVHNSFGPPEVLTIVDVEPPTPRADEVLIKVHATTVTAAEILMRRGRPLWGRSVLGVTRPRKKVRTPGLELAGEVVTVGASVRRFAPGDQVFGFTGIGVGACAEYKCMPESASLEHKPVDITYEDAAAAVDGASTALYFLRERADVGKGHHVLINGASGSIGTYALQLAKLFGAEVTAVCSSRNAELVTELGADHVIDYTVDDFTTRRNTYDVVFDTVTASTYRKCRRALTPTGCYLPTKGLWNWPIAGWTVLRGGRTVRPGMSVEKRASLAFLKELIESGQLRIIVDRNYPIDDIVEAHRYVETGHKRGNVTVSVVSGVRQALS
ncbi:NAD(P)-dependent alcohol dehydrogenase [Nocardia sp. CNY236]|uniref:NAD(P)-dependent alcohol dehydrogenase n=1 Tax=Nocardia sp. CNY236 TaxID=1169152 RepID=UPI0004124630|nr:NAD(P)-dependent alcohol dehydrogenase [Nocardia sp. CNY236]